MTQKVDSWVYNWGEAERGVEKTLIQKDTCISSFIAALFTIAKIWKQP